MAYIEGLKERNDALNRIKNNLKEIKAINNNIAFLRDSSLSPSAKKIKLECKYVLKDGKTMTIKVPIVSNDEFVLDALKQHKAKIVNEIRADVQNYRISLEPSEEKMLSIDD